MIGSAQYIGARSSRYGRSLPKRSGMNATSVRRSTSGIVPSGTSGASAGCFGSSIRYTGAPESVLPATVRSFSFTSAPANPPVPFGCVSGRSVNASSFPSFLVKELTGVAGAWNCICEPSGRNAYSE